MKSITKFSRILLISLLLVVIVGTFAVSAVVPYTSYTYDVNGVKLESPHAYVPLNVITSQTISDSYENTSDQFKSKHTLAEIGKLNSPGDIAVDDLNHVYIADTGNNRIIGLDANYNIRLIIKKFVNDQGIPDELASPTGLYITDSEIFVADTAKSRIVIFDKLGNFVHIIPEPTSEVMEGNNYSPIAVAADRTGNTVYVVSSGTFFGIVSMRRDGTFNAFLGAQKVTYSAVTLLRRKFMTPEQIKKMPTLVPTEYNNLTIDADGFLFATTASIDPGNVYNAISTRSKSGDYAPIKRLNPSGKDVMRRDGFWPPSGEIPVRSEMRKATSVSAGAGNQGVSTLVDVALGPYKTWSIIDQDRSRIFTYDESGNLLFAFGDKGDQVGNLQKAVALDYQGDRLLVLDGAANSITVFKRTAYGDYIAAAIRNNADKNYTAAVNDYKNVLQRNNNYEVAYLEIAKSLEREGKYLDAMQYYKASYNTENYSTSYKMFRKEWVEKNVWVVPVAIIAAVILLSKFFKFAGEYNKKGQRMTDKRTLGSEIMYGFHVIFHPFDGFWDIKHEKRASLKGAFFWLGTTTAVFMYQAIAKPYLLAPYGAGIRSISSQIYTVVLPLILWVVANWCLTTLFDGEGSFRDVFIASCYAIIPLPLLTLPVALLQNFATLEEMPLYNMIAQIGFVWMFILIFFAMMVIHDYSLFRNILTTIGTIVGIGFIIFIAGLFSQLIMKVFTFGYNIYVELKYRWT